MSSANWKCDFQQMKKLLDQVNAYVECHDWKNAHHVAKLLQFDLTFYPKYEEERVKNSNCSGGKNK